MYENSIVNLIEDIRNNLDNFGEQAIKDRHDQLLEEFYKIVTN